jgi:EAL domain-containing protein (putative c-di-GMP-specific phosphodiesterase class I)
MLAELDCQLAQGFLISPALPGEQLLAGIADWRAPEPSPRQA